MVKQQKYFRDELRKTLIVHALAPCILSLLLLVLGYTVFGFRQIIQQNKQTVQENSAVLSALFQSYVAEGRRLSQTLDPRAIERLPSRRVEMASQVYQFLNSQRTRGDFYLFDHERDCIFSTQSDPVSIQNISTYLLWNTGERKESNGGDIIFIYDIDQIGGDAVPAWLIFYTIRQGAETAGYCGFVLSADRLKLNPDGQDQTIFAVNRFGRVFDQGDSVFVNERGKLHEDFQVQTGLVHVWEHWYYVNRIQVQAEEIWIYGIHDCQTFVQLCVISMVLVCGLALILSVAIYWSAGTLADRKTLIIDELIDALDQVEKGNLNVTLDITTGDEFEHIGNSFNIMLGSIRHLLARHQALAQENMQATMQILESQFNPHFLFNTLESIRWMIRFSPREAEKMLVSLSRLLRYSIQGGKDQARLEEEVRFVEQYLQIMLYRYAQRLEYRIYIQEECRGLIVPRMILQPLVENSIKYGFGDRREHITVEVRARLEGDALLLQVCDDGVGISPELLLQIRKNMRQEKNETDHIGIYNVNRRIQLMYGEAYGVSIKSTDSGTRISLTLPAAAAEESPAD